MSSMVAAMIKLPHRNVFGKTIRRELTRVTTPKTMTPVLVRFHLPNMASISAFPVTIAQPCLSPMNTATKISTVLIILKIIGKMYNLKLLISDEPGTIKTRRSPENFFDESGRNAGIGRETCLYSVTSGSRKVMARTLNCSSANRPQKEFYSGTATYTLNVYL